MATRKSPAKAKSKAKTKAKTRARTKTTRAKAKARVKATPKKKSARAKAAPKKKAAKAKATPKKSRAKAKAKASPKVKASPKAKASPRAKASNRAKAAPKAKAAPRVKTKARAVAKSPEAHLQAKDFTPYKMKRGEEYMNDQQKEHFKNILLNWRNNLMEEVDRTVHHMQDEAANPPDPADRATLEEEFSIELRTRDRERRLIKKIDSTIEMIANDEYGWCDSCGVEIGIRRLEARPTANKCIDCKTLDEIKEKQLGA